MDKSLGSLDVDNEMPWSVKVSKARSKHDMRRNRFMKCSCQGSCRHGTAAVVDSVHQGSLCALERDCRQGSINSVEQFAGSWERIPVTVDSGAVDSVIPRRLARGVPTKQTEASKQGLKYRSASGNPIINEGEKDLHGYTKEGNSVNMCMQVAEVTKPLGSVRAYVRAGNRVVFDDAGIFIQNKATGMKTSIEDRNGAYVFDLWIPRAEREKRVSTGSFDALVNEEEEGESSVFAGLDDLM